jgi:hypothetical protein
VNGDRPEFTDAERLDALVGPHECLQRLQVESTVGMGYICPRQPVHTRVPTQVVALCDLRQDPVEAAREVVPDLPDLLVHDVEVVEEPLLGLCDLALLSNRLDDVPVPGEQHLAVLANAWEQSASL